MTDVVYFATLKANNWEFAVERVKAVLAAIVGYSIMIGFGGLMVWSFFSGSKPAPKPDVCQTVSIPYETTEEDYPGGYIGDYKVTTRGVDGERRTCTSESGTQTVNKVITEPVNEVKQVGHLEPEPEYEEPVYQGGSICNDGSYSYSVGRGTCSWHGGVDYYL